MSPEFYSLDSILRDEQIKAAQRFRPDTYSGLSPVVIDIALVRCDLSDEENQ